MGSRVNLVIQGFQDTQGERARGDSEVITERKVPGVQKDPKVTRGTTVSRVRWVQTALRAGLAMTVHGDLWAHRLVC